MAKQAHVVLRGSKRAKDPYANRVGDADPNERIDVTITLAGPKLPGPNDPVEKMTPAELERKYGAKKDADAVAKSLKAYGLKIESVSLPTRSMRVSGKISDLSKAFKVKLVMMRSSRQDDYRGRTGTLSIPAELQGIVTGVFGLDERRMVDERRRSQRAAAAAPPGLAPLSPPLIEQRYNFPPGDGSNQSIAIGEFGGGYFSGDVAAYCNKYQRPIPTVNAVAVDAPAYTLQQILALPSTQRKTQLGYSVEVMMDIEIIAGLCPAASLSVYFSTFDQQGWVDLLNAVISSPPPVALSLSWGTAEDDTGWSSSAVTAINDRLNALRLLGVTTCVSSGDDGAGDLVPDGKAHVDFPASSPYVLAVGGTMIKNSGGTLKEVTWNDPPGQRYIGNQPTNGGSTGGGVSTVFARPTWQNVSVASLNGGTFDGRVVPDVAAVAGSPFYDLFFAGNPAPNGGTSAVRRRVGVTHYSH